MELRHLAMGTVVAAFMAVTSLTGLTTANASEGPPIYLPTGYMSGYQVSDPAGFRYVYAKFKVPSPADGQAYLTGVYLTDTDAGRAAGCGWDDPPGGGNGFIGCFDEGAPEYAFLHMLTSITPGDIIAVSMHYYANGRMYVKATDVTAGATDTSSYTYTQGVETDTWDQALVGAIPSATAPATPQVLSSFTSVSLAPVGSISRGLSLGPWTLQPVIDTADGTSTGAVVTSPSALRGNSFTVTQQP